MLNRDKTHLLIFDDFVVDYTLPKYKKEKGSKQNSGDMPDEFIGGAFDNAIIPKISTAGISFGSSPPSVDSKELPLSLWKRFLNLFKSKPKYTVQQFFSIVKGNLHSPEIYIEKVNEFLKVANHAKDLGQIALYESVMTDVNTIKQEAVLLAGDFTTCILEEQIVQFYKDSEKGLSLHFVKNFSRIIPNEVLEIKLKADALKIFDNYVVLYYDKDQKTFKETQAEINKRKDPILFGVINGVRKLYYIADWQDEFCDLTLKQLIDKFGPDAIKANDITVNYTKKTTSKN